MYLSKPIKIAIIGGVLVVAVPPVIGAFTNPNTINAAQGYGKEAQKALATVGSDSSSNTSSSSSSNANPSSASSSASSDSSSTANSSQVRQLTKAYVALGKGTSPDNIDAVKKALLVDDNTTTLTTDANDVKQYTDVGTSDSSVHSSSSIIPGASGSGISVKIVDFNGNNNITEITPAQYAMVAQMAGLKDVVITVTADQPISGHGALAGLYKALAADGIAVSNRNSQVANGMLDATNDAIEANPSDQQSDYSQKLSGAILTASADMNGDPDKAQSALDSALKSAGVTVPASSEDKIVKQLQEFATTPVGSSKGYKDLVSDTADSLLSGNYTKDVNGQIKSVTGYGENVFEKVGSSFKRGWIQIGHWIENGWTSITTAGKGKTTESNADSNSSSSVSSSSNSTATTNGDNVSSSH